MVTHLANHRQNHQSHHRQNQHQNHHPKNHDFGDDFLEDDFDGDFFGCIKIITQKIWFWWWFFGWWCWWWFFGWWFFDDDFLMMINILDDHQKIIIKIIIKIMILDIWWCRYHRFGSDCDGFWWWCNAFASQIAIRRIDLAKIKPVLRWKYWPCTIFLAGFWADSIWFIFFICAQRGKQIAVTIIKKVVHPWRQLTEMRLRRDYDCVDT